MFNRLSAIVLLLCISISAISFAAAQPEGDSFFEEERAKAIVREVEFDEERQDDFITGMQIVKVEVLDGPFKGQELTVENAQSGNPVYDILVERGDKVVLLLETTEGVIVNGYIEDYYRLNQIYVLAAVFLGLLLLIGGLKGVRSLLTLAFTILLVTKVLVPLAVQGYDPLWLAIGVAVISTIVTLLVVGGLNIKSFSAIVGTVAGVFISGILATLFSRASHLTGLSAQEAQMLIYAPQGVEYNFRGLLLAAIIIGALGAVMDVGMSIASAMHEIKLNNKRITRWQLLKSGLNVGRDVMGTMTNTLILAYAGTALPLLMLFMAYDMPLVRIINLDLIGTEIVRALSGSIGLICAIPLTAVVSAFLYTRKETLG